MWSSRDNDIGVIFYSSLYQFDILIASYRHVSSLLAGLADLKTNSDLP